MRENRGSLWRAAWLIARREYLERVRSRAFLLTTILTPLVLGAIFGGRFLTGDDTPGLYHIAIASPDAPLAHSVEQALAVNTVSAAIELKAPATEATRATLARRLDAGELDGYLWLERQAGAPLAVYASGAPADTATRLRLESAIREGMAREQLLGAGVSPERVSETLGPVTLQTEIHHADRSGKSTYLMVMLLYIIVVIYGIDVARSVVQEKTSRIFEVLLATVEPESLMLGKLLGVGAAGFTQVAAWFALLGIASASSIATRIGISGFSSLGVTPVEACFFVIYFALGYLFYSGIAAGIGASLSAEQEMQQFSFVLVAPMLVSVLLMERILRDPDSALAVGLSFFPPCTPVVMYLRLCAHQPPAWQLALSVVLMLAAIALVVWLAARVYRVGILMYGKRPTLPELLRWLRYS